MVARGAFLVHVDQGGTECRAEKRGESNSAIRRLGLVPQAGERLSGWR
jgi:hypothetical protein